MAYLSFTRLSIYLIPAGVTKDLSVTTEAQRKSFLFFFNTGSTTCVHWLGLRIPGPQGVNYPAVILLNDTLNGFGIPGNRGISVEEVLTGHRCTVYYDVRSGEISFDVRSEDDRLKHAHAHTCSVYPHAHTNTQMIKPLSSYFKGHPCYL